MKVTDEQLQELKQIELNMFQTFIQICSQLNLRYYLLGGTLLGAVRHKGFIPWDDDIDVGMPREDYEVFLEKAPAFMPEHLFIQSINSEPEYLMCFAKIRNSNTTFLETSINHLNINHGVFIDIFPLDYYPADEKERKAFEKKKNQYNARITMEFNLPKGPFKTRLKLMAIRLLNPSLKKAIEKREKLYRSVPASAYMANLGGAWGAKEIVPAQWYGEGTTLEFEGMEVSAPVKYREWLTQVYGDYMQLPPEEKRVSHHYVDVMDLQKSYKAYVRR